MISNFEFLSGRWKELAEVGRASEKNVLTDPNAALIKLRLFGELLVRTVFVGENLPEPNRMSQKDRLDLLYTDGILDIELFKLLDSIRKIGNKAVHEANYGSVDEAKSLLKQAFYLAAWLQQAYGDWNFEVEKYIEPDKLQYVSRTKKPSLTSISIEQSQYTNIMRFSNDDASYEQWLRDYPHGYVFNHFGGQDGSKDMNKIHRSSCRYLLQKRDEGKRTTVYEKICATSLPELEAFVSELRKDSWVYCKSCY